MSEGKNNTRKSRNSPIVLSMGLKVIDKASLAITREVVPPDTNISKQIITLKMRCKITVVPCGC